MRYQEFNLTEGYKEVQQKFSQEADPTKVAAAFDVFKKLVSANRIAGQERNIDWWGNQGWAAFIEYVTAIDERPSSSEQKMRKNKGTSHVIEESADWFIVVPLDKDASCFYGKKSSWCTTKPTQAHFESYFRSKAITLVYFFRQSDGAMWAMAVYPDKRAEYFDQADKSLDVIEFNKQTGLDSNEYIEMVGGKTEIGKKTAASRKEMRASLKNLKDFLKKLEQMDAPQRSAKIETMMLQVKDPRLIEEYFKILHKQSGPVEIDQQLQTLVANISTDAVRYLQDVSIKTVKIMERNATRGEVINNVRNPTKQVLAYIASRGALAVTYAAVVIKGRWPPGEAVIAQDGYYAALYARDILKRKWPEAEAAIANNSFGAYTYAIAVLNKAWPPGEAAIATHTNYSFLYATEVLEDRFLKGENAIRKVQSAWNEYKKRFDID